jgi:hypothetical protein
MTEPEQEHYEPLTPVQIEREVRHLHKERARAQQMIEAARVEVVKTRSAVTSAKGALTVAIAKAGMREDCPVMGRGSGQVSKDERTGWIVLETLDERAALETATNNAIAARAVLDAAFGFAKQVSEQMMTGTSLNKSTTEAYRTSGGPR